MVVVVFVRNALMRNLDYEHICDRVVARHLLRSRQCRLRLDREVHSRSFCFRVIDWVVVFEVPGSCVVLLA